MRGRLLVVAVVGVFSLPACAADWPQWRGVNRDAKVAGFTAPKTWPKELKRQWKVTVGEGVSSPALAGDKLYVFAREGASEITRCLDAATGKEVWQEKYDSPAVAGIAAGRDKEFQGTRSSPTVAEGKVVTLGARGTLSCLDAATGKKLWRKDDFNGKVPIVADGLCFAQVGGDGDGGIVAYDLATGNQKWKWTDDGTAYASPILHTVAGTKILVAETAKNIVALNLADGKLLWQTPFAPQGRGRTYNACTPMVDGQTVIYSGTGRGTKAVQFEKQGEKLTAKELWSNTDNAVQFNTPVVKDGLLYGLTVQDGLFCLDMKTGKSAWGAPVKGERGYASIVDAGPVLLLLTPASQLIVFEPGDKGFKEIASYKVADSKTFAYPIVSDNRVYVKDRDSVILWTIE
jgi:outer membrane protein assembly factor BamB